MGRLALRGIVAFMGIRRGIIWGISRAGKCRTGSSLGWGCAWLAIAYLLIEPAGCVDTTWAA